MKIENRKYSYKNSNRDLKIRTYYFAINLIRMLDKLPKDYITQTLANQLLRAATSIGANVIEAQAASSKKDFTNFLNHSLKSGNETKFWLGLIRETRNSSELVNPLLKEVVEFSNILASSILTIRGKRNL